MSGTKLLEHWSPPDGAGDPVACLATTFTFQADFFSQDCLARFLSLSTVADEGDAISSLAALLEEEDRLSEAQVSVLVDRSCQSEKRNLRWDLLPVAVPRGLLHAKVAVLLWERSARVILGSANLTSAGYRSQVELALAVDLDIGCQVPRAVLDELVDELRQLVRLAPGETMGPKERALATVDLLDARVASLALPNSMRRDLRMVLAPSRPGLSPLTRLADVWRGGQPLRSTVVSPFWDDRVPAPAVRAIRSHLTGRPASRRRMTLVAATDPSSGAVEAPSSLGQQGADLVCFDPPDDEPRRLHAKLILVESDEWVAAMIGSSNATEAGLGLNQHQGHRELNLWLGCPVGSPTAKRLRALARPGVLIDIEDAPWDPVIDEDEPTTPVLPLGFATCTLDIGAPARARLGFVPDKLPERWEVRTPAGTVVTTSDDWNAEESPSSSIIALPDETLPAYLLVHWQSADGETCRATWTANIEDRSTLPPPAELAGLAVDLILATLASTRPLPFALEHELRRRERIESEDGRIDLDPLHRFDDSGLLLQRTRHLSLALWRLQDRLGRPATSLDAVHWRLHGALGPLAIADGLVRAVDEQLTLPGEAHFLLAELALTIGAVDWPFVATNVGIKSVRGLVADVLAEIELRRSALPAVGDASLDAYVCDALEAAQR